MCFDYHPKCKNARKKFSLELYSHLLHAASNCCLTNCLTTADDILASRRHLHFSEIWSQFSKKGTRLILVTDSVRARGVAFGAWVLLWRLLLPRGIAHVTRDVSFVNVDELSGGHFTVNLHHGHAAAGRSH
jgi:hypothetical protein